VTGFVVIGSGGIVAVNLAQAKAHLRALLDRVEAGEEVVVTRHGRTMRT
jgi:antitoxin (DNA-binding transcriptional repressor) of toxin-antitoxin stability system